MNYYDILKVKPDASFEEIKISYKSLVKKYHPDIYPGDKTFAERKTKELNAAYDILSDPQKRAEYDAEIFTVHDCDNPNNINSQENYYDYYKDINSSSFTNNYSTSNRNTYQNYTSYQDYTNHVNDKSYNKVREKVITYASNLSHLQKVWVTVICIFIILAIITSCSISLISDISRIFYMTEDSYINNKIQEYNNTTFNNDYINTANTYDDYLDNDYNTLNEPLITNSDLEIRKGYTRNQITSLLGDPEKVLEYPTYYAWYYADYIVYFEKEHYTVFAVLSTYEYKDFMKY